MPFKIIFGIICLTLGSILSYQDIRYKKINLILTILYCVSCFVIRTENFTFIPFYILIIIGVFYKIFMRKLAFGMGDYIFLFSSCFLIDENFWPVFLIISGIVGCILSIFCKKSNKIPFIPSIFVAMLSSMNILK